MRGYKAATGDGLYRRTIYTVWKRTAAPPTMLLFDSPNREICTVKRSRTNTPLQALSLMNEVTYVEAARVLAQRILIAGERTPEERLSLAFRLATARPPRPRELQILLRGFYDHLARYRRDPKAALELVSAGEAPRDQSLEVSQLAAYTAMAGLILNLDETITKE